MLKSAGYLVGEVVEALLGMATGLTSQVAQPIAVGVGPFDRPERQCRFPVLKDVKELECAPAHPW